jgi:nicotianamine synthase
MELSAIHAVTPPVEGLSSQQNGEEIEVLNIDHSSLAIAQSRSLSQSLGQRAKSMTFLHHDASSPLDLKSFDVVYLAALVGLSQEEKEGILEEVVGGMKEGSLVVIRTAWGLRGLLYPVCYSLSNEI